MIQSLQDYDARSINGVERIRNTADLPPAGATGEHELEDNTAYWFDDIVVSDAPIRLGATTPLLGNHGGVSGFIYTNGGGASDGAIRGTGAPLFMRNLLVSAPGGAIFDVAGDVTTETLVESCAFSDPAGFGDLASLGTIDGFRVPSFKGCNFEDFADGLTFTGAPDKVFISQSPFRDTPTGGTQCITLDAALDVAIIDIAGCYGKGFAADTEFVHTEAGGEPTEVLQLRGTTFDSDTTTANILTGALNESSVGVSVQSCWPLADSQPGITYSLTNEPTVSFPAQDPGDGSQAVKIGGTTEVFGPVTDRFTHTSPNRATYQGRRAFTEKIQATVAVSGSNTTLAIYIAKNGSVLNRSSVTLTTASAGQPRAATVVSRVQLLTDDYLEVWLANEGGTGDITVSTLDVTI